MRPRAVLAGCALWLACATGPPPPVQLELETWSEVSSEHFVVLGNASERRMEALVRDLELLQDRRGLLHHRELGGRGRQDADHGRPVAHLRSSPAAAAATSVRCCIPSNEIRSTASYARSRA